VRLLFDIDGTVVDHGRRTYRLYRQYAGENGFAALDPAAYTARKRQGLDERAVARETFPPGVVDEYLEWKRARIESAQALRHDVLVAGMEQTLATLARRDRLIAVSARQSNGALVDELARLGIGPLFDEFLPVDPSDPVGSKAAAIGSYLARVAGDERDAALIGDTETEIAAAERVGIPCISVGWGLREPSVLARHGARRIVESPAELVEALDELRP
jgi:phosphoglycolate phosphatase